MWVQGARPAPGQAVLESNSGKAWFQINIGRSECRGVRVRPGQPETPGMSLLHPPSAQPPPRRGLFFTRFAEDFQSEENKRLPATGRPVMCICESGADQRRAGRSQALRLGGRGVVPKSPPAGLAVWEPSVKIRAGLPRPRLPSRPLWGQE